MASLFFAWPTTPSAVRNVFSSIVFFNFALGIQFWCFLFLDFMVFEYIGVFVLMQGEYPFHTWRIFIWDLWKIMAEWPLMLLLMQWTMSFRGFCISRWSFSPAILALILSTVWEAKLVRQVLCASLEFWLSFGLSNLFVLLFANYFCLEIRKLHLLHVIFACCLNKYLRKTHLSFRKQVNWCCPFKDF